MSLGIECTCEVGSRTIALWPSMTLLHWFGRSYPTSAILRPEPFKIYVVASSIPADDDEKFLTLLYAEIERRWNKTPPLEIIPPNPKNKHGGRKYQARCLEILRWLHANGNIATLKVSHAC
jgi:hypothetical protein